MNITAKQQLVLDAIKQHPKAADDDALLMATVWSKEGWDDSLSLYDNLSHVTRPETLTRRRRELHDLGLVTYSSDADKTRYEAFKREIEEHIAVSWLND